MPSNDFTVVKENKPFYNILEGCIINLMPYISSSLGLEVASLFSKTGGFGPHYPKHADSLLRAFLTHLPLLALKEKKDKRIATVKYMHSSPDRHADKYSVVNTLPA